MLPDLLPGAALDEILESALRDAAASAGNLSSWSGTDIGSRIAAYSMFCLDRSRLLGRILRPAAISHLLLTPEYFAIIGLTSISLAAPELIAFELERCQERLEAARVDVAGERRRWREAFTIVVCDTNVFAQAVTCPLAEFDWHKAIGTPRFDDLTIVIPAVVIDELDGLKNRGTTDARSRSRKTLRELDVLFSYGAWAQLSAATLTSARVRLAAFLDEVDHVRLPSADNEIIDRTLALTSRVPGRVVLLTGDTGMALRARQAGIKCVKLPTPASETPTPKKH